MTQGSRCDIGAYEAASAIAGSGTYDDTHPVWLYTVNWTIYTGSGPYNNTTHYTSTTGDAAIVLFNGTQFSLTYTRSSSYGSIAVYVDNALVTTINTYSASTLWQQTYTSPVYPAGPHTVRFVHAGGGNYVEVDAITIMP
jgi:hypothetical protein